MGCMSCPFDSATPSMAMPWMPSQLYSRVEGDRLNPRTEPMGCLKNIAYMTLCLAVLFLCCCRSNSSHHVLSCGCLPPGSNSSHSIKLLHKFSSCFRVVVDAHHILPGVSCQNHADPMFVEMMTRTFIKLQRKGSIVPMLCPVW